MLVTYISYHSQYLKATETASGLFKYKINLVGGKIKAHRIEVRPTKQS